MMTSTTSKRLAAVIVMIGAAAGLAGCEKYTLRGRIVSGGTPMMLVVSADDPQLEGPGVAGAGIDLTLDPDSLGRQPLGLGYTDGNGDFAIPIDKFGAGTLEYAVGADVRRQGFEPMRGRFVMPGSDSRLLIVMVRGDDRDLPPRDTLDQAHELNRQEDSRKP